MGGNPGSRGAEGVRGQIAGFYHVMYSLAIPSSIPSLAPSLPSLPSLAQSLPPSLPPSFRPRTHTDHTNHRQGHETSSPSRQRNKQQAVAAVGTAPLPNHTRMISHTLLPQRSVKGTVVVPCGRRQRRYTAAYAVPPPGAVADKTPERATTGVALEEGQQQSGRKGLAGLEPEREANADTDGREEAAEEEREGSEKAHAFVHPSLPSSPLFAYSSSFSSSSSSSLTTTCCSSSAASSSCSSCSPSSPFSQPA